MNDRFMGIINVVCTFSFINIRRIKKLKYAQNIGSIKEKKKLSIALILLLTLSATITLAPAQAIDIPTFLFVTASPSPVGVGQTVYVGITFSRPTPTGGGYAGDLYEDITLEITDPDGKKTTHGPYLASPVAGVVFSFSPDKVGNYTLQAFYPGQVLTGTNPNNPTLSSNSFLF